MSTHSYPKVHVVGSGAYYAYRPITRFIEKADRFHIRENSSRPKDFNQYMAATSATRDHGRYPRSSSLPPFDPSREQKQSRGSGDGLVSKHMEDDFSAFKNKMNESFGKLEKDGSVFDLKSKRSESFGRRGKNVMDDLSHRHIRHQELYPNKEREASIKRMGRASTLRMEEDEALLEKERKKIFATVDDPLSRLRLKHPYRLQVENEVVPPHESSIWPENRPHFDLVSSYDVMVDYLGIREKSKN